MIIITKYLVPPNYIGLTVYPFIFLKKSILKNDRYLINHEKIHLQQQKEMAWLFFFCWYLMEYLFRLIQFKNHTKAYRNISFEKEAYKNEGNFNYLLERKKFSFINYL